MQLTKEAENRGHAKVEQTQVAQVAAEVGGRRRRRRKTIASPSAVYLFSPPPTYRLSEREKSSRM